MNLYLTSSYFDSLPNDRISKILAYENDEIKKLKDSDFISRNQTLYDITYSIWYQNQSRQSFGNLKEINRSSLLRLKSVLDRAIHYYNSAKIYDYQTFQEDPSSLYQMINFDAEASSEIKYEILNLKYQYNKLFNEDIFPEFKRLLIKAKESNDIQLDSLTYFANLYDMPVSMSIIENKQFIPQGISFENFYIKREYQLENRMEVISMYMQLKSLANQRTRVPASFDPEILFDQYDRYLDLLRMEGDDFVKNELTSQVNNELLRLLRRKFPNPENEKFPEESMAFIEAPAPDGPKMYFFPNPAPLASANLSTKNYRSDLKTLNQVDQFLKSRLSLAGFKENVLHYYYDLDGYAMTTSLEKFNKNGSEVSPENRFSESMGDDGKFSYFEIFKSLFFDMESDYRMFAFIVASNSATMTNHVMTMGFAEEILKNSYDNLPEDLKERSIPNQTLSIFVYHFHQNDIGEVPELDRSGSFSVQNHLKSAGISQILP